MNNVIVLHGNLTKRAADMLAVALNLDNCSAEPMPGVESPDPNASHWQCAMALPQDYQPEVFNRSAGTQTCLLAVHCSDVCAENMPDQVLIELGEQDRDRILELAGAVKILGVAAISEPMPGSYSFADWERESLLPLIAGESTPENLFAVAQRQRKAPVREVTCHVEASHFYVTAAPCITNLDGSVEVLTSTKVPLSLLAAGGFVVNLEGTMQGSSA